MFAYLTYVYLLRANQAEAASWEMPETSQKFDLQNSDSSSNESETLLSGMEATKTQWNKKTDQDEDRGPGTSSQWAYLEAKFLPYNLLVTNTQ